MIIKLTPLHPSQEGNRTGQALKSASLTFLIATHSR